MYRRYFHPTNCRFPRGLNTVFISSALLDASEKHPNFQKLIFFNVCGHGEGEKKIRIKEDF